MSQQPQPTPLVSPTAYIHRTFGEWCEENVLNPQEILMLLLYKFLQTCPEQRINDVRHMKHAFTQFADSGDFEGLQKTIDDGVKEIELSLLTSLEKQWENQAVEI
ncbi:MAG: hypothetical protein KAJ01_02855 [Candidatus Hydrogenedentes bacterium]|nr:hypothetical protein [Candidatus Hydrogenedentota bacterium]